MATTSFRLQKFIQERAQKPFLGHIFYFPMAYWFSPFYPVSVDCFRLFQLDTLRPDPGTSFLGIFELPKTFL